MTIDDRIINGTAIEIVNPETGVVEWWEFEGGKEYSHDDLINFLPRLGWNYGEFLFLKEEGEFTKISTENINWDIAVISTRLAESFRNDPFALFVKESSNS